MAFEVAIASVKRFFYDLFAAFNDITTLQRCQMALYSTTKIQIAF
jgi:hypothetical protein